MSSDRVDADELRKCAVCGRGMMHGGDVHFYEVTITQCVVDMDAVRQLHGMEVMMGAMGAAAPLARAMSPVRHVAVRMPSTKVMICATCAGSKTSVHELMESSGE